MDTRSGGGEVRWLTGTTAGGHAYVRVDWVDVGYFDRNSAGNTNARNAFSLYIEDDPNGDVVVFDYESAGMDHRRHDRHGRVRGLGAQIGFDAGDGDPTQMLSLMRPNSPADLSDLLQMEQRGFRISPATGEPIEAEPGLAGIIVYLDLNGNGILDHDGFGNEEPSRVTRSDDPSTAGIDETGYYEFTGLFDGSYQVREWIDPALYPELIPTHPSAATGDIRVLQNGAGITDGSLFTVNDGSKVVTYEFDNNDSVTETPTLRAVDILGGDTPDQIAAAIAAAVEATPNFKISATSSGSAVKLTAEAGSSVGLGLAVVGGILEDVTSFSNGGWHYDVNLGAGESFEDANFGNFFLPRVSVSDVAVWEGDDPANPTRVDVTVHVTKSYGSALVVDYHTVDGTATLADGDYQGASGQITIDPKATPLGAWNSSVLATTGTLAAKYDVAGDYVVWEARDGADKDIYLYDGARNLVLQLTHNAREDSAPKVHVSADGSTVYVVWVGRDGSGGDDSQIFLYTYDTQTATGVTTQVTHTRTRSAIRSRASGRPTTPTSRGGAGRRAATRSYLYDVTTRATTNISAKVPGHGDGRLRAADLRRYRRLVRLRRQGQRDLPVGHRQGSRQSELRAGAGYLELGRGQAQSRSTAPAWCGRGGTASATTGTSSSTAPTPPAVPGARRRSPIPWPSRAQPTIPRRWSPVRTSFGGVTTPTIPRAAAIGTSSAITFHPARLPTSRRTRSWTTRIRRSTATRWSGSRSGGRQLGSHAPGSCRARRPKRIAEAGAGPQLPLVSGGLVVWQNYDGQNYWLMASRRSRSHRDDHALRERRYAPGGQRILP